MNETRDLVQRAIAALWDSASSLGTDEKAHAELAGLVDAVADAEAQLAGLRLFLLHEARLTGADTVIAEAKQSVRTTVAQATSALKLSQDLAERFPLIGAALNDSVISLAQAEAIVGGLKKLPHRLTRTEMEQCQRSVLEHVEDLGPSELRVLASRLAEVVDPEQTEADEAKRLEAEERAAHRNRFLRLAPDHHGSVRITGQLSVSDAALLTAQLDALMPPASSYSDTGEIPTRDMRRADALVLLTQTAANAGTLPQRGCDRPTVHVTMSLDTLKGALGRTGLFSIDEIDAISAKEARRLACDADLIPIVLGSESQPLDVGRKSRTFPSAIRAALIERDKGCAFPNCNVPAAGCEAHHIVPYVKGLGPSSLANGVLLCPYHHRVVEPACWPLTANEWEVRLDEVTGLPWFTPPKHIDPSRRPRQHSRFVLEQITLEPPPEAPPCPDPVEAPSVPEVQLVAARPSADREQERARLEQIRGNPSPAWAGAG